MSFANKLWEHPTGDNFKIPCHHLQLVQTDTANISVPTGVTIGKQHDFDQATDPSGKKHNVPCLHLSADVATGTMSIPIYQLQPEHPNGHDSPIPAPCFHPLTVKWVDTNRHLVFFTDDLNYRSIVVELVDKLRSQLHVRNVGNPARPLLFFFREAVGGNPDDNTDPFWSHYDPGLHAIQIIRDPNKDFSSRTSSGYKRAHSHLPHELGHAIVGQSCVQVINEADPHWMKQPSHPGEAMSEGWADFVRAVLSRDGRGTPGGSPIVNGKPIFDLEVRDTTVPMTKDIEYNVMCILWDLYDIPTTITSGIHLRGNETVRTVPRPVLDDEAADFSFEELFSVFSPSLETLWAGPIIWDVDNYLSRLKTLYPDRAAVIDAVRAVHLA